MASKISWFGGHMAKTVNELKVSSPSPALSEPDSREQPIRNCQSLSIHAKVAVCVSGLCTITVSMQ